MIIVSIAAAIASTLLAYAAIRSLRRLLAASEIAIMPVVSEQSVTLERGTVELAVRGRQFMTGFGGVSFTLQDARTRKALAGTPVLARTKTVSLAGEVTLGLVRFEVPNAADYVVSARGLHAGTDYSQARLVLRRPHTLALVVSIVWLVGAGVMLVAAVVFAVLLASGVAAPY